MPGWAVCRREDFDRFREPLARGHSPDLSNHDRTPVGRFPFGGTFGGDDRVGNHLDPAELGAGRRHLAADELANRDDPVACKDPLKRMTSKPGPRRVVEMDDVWHAEAPRDAFADPAVEPLLAGIDQIDVEIAGESNHRSATKRVQRPSDQPQ